MTGTDNVLQKRVVERRDAPTLCIDSLNHCTPFTLPGWILFGLSLSSTRVPVIIGPLVTTANAPIGRFPHHPALIIDLLHFGLRISGSKKDFLRLWGVENRTENVGGL